MIFQKRGESVCGYDGRANTFVDSVMNNDNHEKNNPYLRKI